VSAPIPLQRKRRQRDELAIAAKRLRNLRIEIVPQRRPSGAPKLPGETGGLTIDTASRVLAAHIVGATR